MTKQLDTLIPDIYALFNKEHEVNEDNLKAFAKNIGDTVKARLEAIQKFNRPTLRVSKLGTPDRKLWYELTAKPGDGNDDKLLVSPTDCIKFLYGDIIEELLLLLAKEAGHKVEGEQGEIEIDGVVGHRDCIIDGITLDIKSTSRFAFTKFERGTLYKDDPFGYIAQISSYAYADKSPYGAFLAMNKESGQLALLKVDKVDMIHPPTRVKHVREMLEETSPPTKKCYDPVPQGKSGNMALQSNCTYCAFKDVCWKDANGGAGLRRFRYSNGIKYLVNVAETPKVEEIVVD